MAARGADGDSLYSLPLAMTIRRAYACGAALVLGGALLGITAAWSIGRPDSLVRSLLIAATAYIAGGALVLRWGLDVYGPRGAVWATALYAFTPPLLAAVAAPSLQAPAGAAVLAGMLAQLVATYALTRCLLDPTLQWVLVAGLAIVAAPIGAFLHGDGAAVLVAMGGFSLLLVVWRTATADRCESARRVARGSAVSAALAWLLAATLALAVAALSHLPSFEEYGRLTNSRPEVVARASDSGRAFLDGLVAAAAAAEGAPAESRARAAGLGSLPLAALLVAAARPWRRWRRYSDGAWVLALLCLGGSLWLVWGAPGGVFMAPHAALLGAAVWDGTRPAWLRRIAAAVVVAQIGIALIAWPHWRGGIRPDAWLPMPGIEIPPAEAGP